MRSSRWQEAWGVANMLYGYAVLGAPPAPAILDALDAAAERTAWDMVPQAVSDILWSYAVFDRSPPPAVVEASGANAVQGWRFP